MNALHLGDCFRDLADRETLWGYVQFFACEILEILDGRVLIHEDRDMEGMQGDQIYGIVGRLLEGLFSEASFPEALGHGDSYVRLSIIHPNDIPDTAAGL